MPILDTIAAWIDTRIRTTQLVAEQTLTKDTVPVDVDAIILWVVTDVQRAALLSNRRAADEELRKTIDAKTTEWGINVRSVEIRDVRIPVALQDAMSRQAQAERERQARVILGSAEAEIAQKFVAAAETYASNPVALHRRGMNMLYESVKERGSTIIVPSSAIDSMNLGGIASITSLAKKPSDGETGADAPKPAPAPPR